MFVVPCAAKLKPCVRDSVFLHRMNIDRVETNKSS